MAFATGTISSGGTAVSALGLMHGCANLLLQNQSAGPLMFAIDGTTASATNGFLLAGGLTIEWPIQFGSPIKLGGVSVWGASTGQQFYVYAANAS